MPSSSAKQKKLEQLPQRLGKVDELWQARVTALEEIREWITDGWFEGDAGIQRWAKLVHYLVMLQVGNCAASLLVHCLCGHIP
jgi:hypothetical protein